MEEGWVRDLIKVCSEGEKGSEGLLFMHES